MEDCVAGQGGAQAVLHLAHLVAHAGGLVLLLDNWARSAVGDVAARPARWAVLPEGGAGAGEGGGGDQGGMLKERGTGGAGG